MARETKVTCDGCGKVKAETNHWFVIVKAHTHFSVVTPLLVDIASFEGDIELFDLCGEACVIKAVSELIGGKT